MKAQTTMAMAAALLLGGAVTASAADVASSHSGMANSAMAKPVSDTLSLSSAQQKTAWSDLSSQASQNAPAGFNATDGAKVPATLKIEAVPAKAARDVSQLRPYDFTKVQNKILIVNPHDRMIAEVISG
jgi:hypothetical protein